MIRTVEPVNAPKKIAMAREVHGWPPRQAAISRPIFDKPRARGALGAGVL
jgi:hypothetical protein